MQDFQWFRIHVADVKCSIANCEMEEAMLPTVNQVRGRFQ